MALGWILDSTSKEGGELGWQSRKGAAVAPRPTANVIKGSETCMHA